MHTSREEQVLTLIRTTSFKVIFFLLSVQKKRRKKHRPIRLSLRFLIVSYEREKDDEEEEEKKLFQTPDLYNLIVFLRKKDECLTLTDTFRG